MYSREGVRGVPTRHCWGVGRWPRSVLVIWILLQVGVTIAWREVKKPCAAGCETVGNCNHEFGVCECPFGFQGSACEEPTLGACRSSGDPKAVVFYASAHSKSCACLQQLHKYAWNKERKVSYLESVERLPGLAFCYERTGVPVDEQFSDPPKTGENGIVWKSVNDATAKLELQTLDTPPPQGVSPMSECMGRCNERGICVKGSCKCVQGFGGLSCEMAHPKAEGCPYNCSGTGVCKGGFCHCPTGIWGMDCSRSKAYEPDPENKLEVNGTAYSRTKLRIYRYELPWNVSFLFAKDDGSFSYDRLYSAFEAFFGTFSGDTVTRTENPYEANLFYVPLFAYTKGENAGNPFEYTRRALHYIKDQYPQFWGRNEGKDHFLWLSGDLGACWLLDEPEVQNPIKVVHWGLQVNASDYTRMPNYHWAVDKAVNKEYNCFKMEKDVVAPSWLDNMHGELTHVDLVHQEACSGKERRYLLYFGGSIRHEQFEYSGGARQAFDTHVASRKHPEVAVGGGPERYREATFCLVPYGDGWGNRIGHAMLGACIPVIVQEFVHQPFDDTLVYEGFALRLKVADMPRLLDILKSVSPEQIQQYREKMNEVYKAFHWMPVYGGEAYNYTLISLKRKLFNLWGLHYR